MGRRPNARGGAHDGPGGLRAVSAYLMSRPIDQACVMFCVLGSLGRAVRLN